MKVLSRKKKNSVKLCEVWREAQLFSNDSFQYNLFYLIDGSQNVSYYHFEKKNIFGTE